jgi:hypothetical protein
MSKDIFERLAQGRPPQEPTPLTTPLPTPPAVLELLNWLQRTWAKPVVRARDIYRHGPYPFRDREHALKTAEILEKRGWLIPLKAPRRDVKKWQVTIGPA